MFEFVISLIDSLVVSLLIYVLKVEEISDINLLLKISCVNSLLISLFVLVKVSMYVSDIWVDLVSKSLLEIWELNIFSLG